MVVLTRSPQILGKNTQDSMKKLILNCLENQRNFSDNKSYLPHFLEEYCIVRISCGRQTGQTTAAVELAHNMFEHSAFISLNPILKNNAEHLYRQIYNKALHKTHFCTPLSLEKIYGHPIEAVFVDDVSQMSIETLNKIYSSGRRFLEAREGKPFVLVLVG